MAVRGVIFDLDGLLWVQGAAEPSASVLLGYLRDSGLPFTVLTNDCSVSRDERVEALRRGDLSVAIAEVLTPAVLAANWLPGKGVQSIAYVGAEAARTDLENSLDVRESPPIEAVVVGDLFDSYDRQLLQFCVGQVLEGAPLFALHRKHFWSDGVNHHHLDVGFWVESIERVTGVPAVTVGKPSEMSYRSAIESLGLHDAPSEEVVMISDDLECDLRGAHELGLATIYIGPDDPAEWVDARLADLGAVEAWVAVE